MLNLEDYKLSEEQIDKIDLNEKTKVKISELFSDTSFGVLNRFCQTYNIQTLFDLLQYNLNFLINDINKIGVVKKNNILIRVNNYLSGTYRIPEILKVDFEQLVEQEQNLDFTNFKIGQVFYEHSYKLFRENCLTNNITTLGQLIEFGIDDVLYSIKGMGSKRINTVKQKLQEIGNLTNESNDYTANNLTLGSKIEFVFSASKYGVFRDFCRDNNIQTLEDLKQEDDLYLKLSAYKNLSIPRIEIILNGIKNLNIDVKLNNITNIFKIHPDFALIKTAVLFDEKNCTKIYSNFFNKFEYLQDLNNCDISCLKDSGLLEHQINVIYEKVKFLKYSILEFAEKIFDVYRQEDFYEPFIERINGKTLEEIGDYLNFKTKTRVTRERVRQLEKYGLQEYLRVIDIVSSVLEEQNQYQAYPILRLNVLQNIFGSNKNAKIVFYALKHSREDGWYAFNWTYLSLIQQVVISAVAERITKTLEKIKNTLPEMFLLNPTLKKIETMLDNNNMGYILKEDLITYFKNNGYKQYGQFLSLNKPSKVDMVGFVIKNFYKEGFADRLENGEYNLTDINNIISKVKEYFCEDISNGISDRNIVNTIEKNENIFRWKDSKFIHISNLGIKGNDLDALMDILIEDIQNELEKTEIISTKFIYDKYIDYMKEFNIPDYKCLHSLLRNQVADEFVVTPKYMLQKDMAEKINNKMILLNYLKENDGIILTSITAEQLKWTQALLSSIVNNNKEMLFIDNYKKIIELRKLNLGDKFKDEFLEIINKSFKNGYTNGRLIYERNIEFFNNNSITDGTMVYQIARCFFQDEFVFKRVHILENRDIKQFTTKTLVQKLILDEINKNNSEIIDYKKIYDILVKEYSINQQNVYMEINGNIPNLLFPVSNNELISLKRNEISKSTINFVKEYLSSLIKNDDDYLYVNTLNFNKVPALIFINNSGNVFSFSFNIASFSAFVILYLSEYFDIIDTGKGTREDRETFIVSKNSVYKTYENIINWNYQKRL